MKVCVAQTRPVKGDVQANIDQHKKLISLALSGGANLIIFPELSITGYEPELAGALATDPDDRRFDDFQRISDEQGLTIGIGMPIRKDTDTCIGMILFQPRRPRQVYLKKYIHPDEEAFFAGGYDSIGSIGAENDIALAICYELSIPEHSEKAFESGAKVYIASVAKSVSGVEKANKSLAEIANKYAMAVLMANCIGTCDNFDSGGSTAAWDKKGLLVGQLDAFSEGILVIDTDTEKLTKAIL
jgi:predicted amidohydrolase